MRIPSDSDNRNSNPLYYEGKLYKGQRTVSWTKLRLKTTDFTLYIGFVLIVAGFGW